jgi:hypothetical protein
MIKNLKSIFVNTALQTMDFVRVFWEDNTLLVTAACIFFISLAAVVTYVIVRKCEILVVLVKKKTLFWKKITRLFKKIVLLLKKSTASFYNYNPFMERRKEHLFFFVVLCVFLHVFMFYGIAPYIKLYLVGFVVPSELSWLEQQLTLWQEQLISERLHLSNILNDNGVLMKMSAPLGVLFKFFLKSLVFKVVVTGLSRAWGGLTAPTYLTSELLKSDSDSRLSGLKRYKYLLGEERWSKYSANYFEGVAPTHDNFEQPDSSVQFWPEEFLFFECLCSYYDFSTSAVDSHTAHALNQHILGPDEFFYSGRKGIGAQVEPLQEPDFIQEEFVWEEPVQEEFVSKERQAVSEMRQAGAQINAEQESRFEPKDQEPGDAGRRSERRNDFRQKDG